MKIIGSIILMLIAVTVVLFWLSGMHGHLMFRPHMTQDWVLAGTIVIFFGTSILLLFSHFFKKKENLNRKALLFIPVIVTGCNNDSSLEKWQADSLGCGGITTLDNFNRILADLKKGKQDSSSLVRILGRPGNAFSTSQTIELHYLLGNKCFSTIKDSSWGIVVVNKTESEIENTSVECQQCCIQKIQSFKNVPLY